MGEEGEAGRETLLHVSISEAFASTEIDSLCLAISSITSTASVWLTASVTAVRTAGSKPSTFTSTRYFPGTRAPARYNPSSFVTASKVTRVSSLRIVTDAPGSGAPLPSLMSPVIVLDPLWAINTAGASTAAIRETICAN